MITMRARTATEVGKSSLINVFGRTIYRTKTLSSGIGFE